MNPSEHNTLISLDYINLMSDGDQVFVAEMLQTFLDNIDVDVDRLKACLTNSDKKELREISHKLKGSTQIFEAEQVVAVLKSIETSCVDDTHIINTEEEIQKALNMIEIMKEEVRNQIKQLT